jgi:hypothetical protein
MPTVEVLDSTMFYTEVGAGVPLCSCTATPPRRTRIKELPKC